jgi:hypothetical protein
MPKHGQQQSPGETVRNIVNWFKTQYIVKLLAGTLSHADFLKHLEKSLDSIVRFHVDKINKPDFFKILYPLLESFSQFTDEAFLRQILDLLNENLGPKKFIFSLSNSDGTWRMTCEVKGDQPNPRTFASAVGGGVSAASVVSPSATRSFAAAVGGGCAAEVKPPISEVSQCGICMDATKTHVFIPCGHKCVCEDCGAKCKTCPICRAVVTGTLKIFDC